MPHSLLCILLAAGIAGNTWADVIARDLAATSDGLLTYDSDTQLEWLDLTETYGLFGHQVYSRLAPGGIWEGFRHATRDEVSTLWKNAGIPFLGGPSTTLYAPVKMLASLLGNENGVRALASTTFSVSLGLAGTKLSTSCEFDIFAGGEVCRGTADLNHYFRSNYLNTASSDAGTWLVRDAQPPLPAATPIALPPAAQLAVAALIIAARSRYFLR